MKQQVQLSARQSQKLSPQLQLNLKLLQLSQAELEQEIEQALAVNPVLERRDEPSVSEPMAVDSDSALSASTTDGETFETHGFELNADDGDLAAKLESDYWDTPEDSPDLRGHLREQLHLSALGARDRLLAEAVLDSLEEDGYCLASAGDIAEASGLVPAPDAAEIEAVRHFIRQLEPVGVASRHLSECLQVQLDALAIRTELRQLAGTIAERHLSALAKGAATELASQLQASPTLTAEAFSLLKSLDPKPGARFAHSRTEYIEADFCAVKHQGRWQLQALRENGAGLRINRHYRQLANSGQSQAPHLAPYLQEANRLLAAIKARQETLMRVLHALGARQQAFFEQGPAALAPMRLADIADALGMHESTISRACSGKYLATRHGLFALSRLFRSGLPSQDGHAQSSDAVQARLKALIAAENPDKPLSDAQLLACLQAEGQHIARRTVAKYREALRIAPSHLRRKPA
jgi:RNA polymerase sigma-54 factor